LLGSLVWIVPLLAYNRQTFGGPLKTGYHLWTGSFYNRLSYVFNVKYLATPGWLNTGPGNLMYYLRSLLGLNMLFYSAVFFLAIALGLLSLVRSRTQQRRGLALLLLLALVDLAFYSIYVFRYWRFMLLAGAILAIIGGVGVSVLTRWVAYGIEEGNGHAPAVARAVVSVILLVLIGLTVAASTADGIRLGYTWHTALRKYPWFAYMVRFEATRYLNDQLPDDALVVSGIPPSYLGYYLLGNTARTSMAIARGVEKTTDGPGLSWPVAQERPDLIAKAIDGGIPVYLLDDPETARWPAALTALQASFDFKEKGAVALYPVQTLRLYRLAEKAP
jgi:hypothetical protein